jgi:hypothetical protein
VNHDVEAYYDMYTSIAILICLIGWSSATYHMCPTLWNYQFDTVFSIVVTILFTVTLSAKRTTRFIPSSSVFILLLGFLVLVDFIQTYLMLVPHPNLHLVWWIPMFCLYLMAVYGRLFSVIWAYSPNLEAAVRASGRCSCRPTAVLMSESLRYAREHRARAALFIFLFLSHVVLFGNGMGGLQTSADFFGICVLETWLVYTAYFVITKRQRGQHIRWYVWVLLVVFGVVMSLAILTFGFPSTRWASDLDVSRSLNKDCVFLFYGPHDFFHFLMSISLPTYTLLSFHIDDDLLDLKKN